MPKALKAHPGERVDLVDYVQGANTYTQETQKFFVERELLDRRSRILDGFRVRVEDQTIYPGLVTVFNGNAADREGQHLNNEDLQNDSRSITLLGANTNFYLEIEFIGVESDTDARYFWDPTIPNTPPEPDGSEFSLNVATRISPDWRVVSPVSTTGFEQTTNPSSVRIPVAVFRTDSGNAISGGTNPGLTYVRAASVLEADTAIGATQLRVVDARIFPTPPFVVDVDFGSGSVESRTVTSVDRDNSILSLGVAIASAHPAGAIIRVTSGTASLVRENTDPSDPALSPLLSPPGHPDPAQRLWQANEVRGSALIQSKEAVNARDDLNVRSLKDQIDYLSAQIREMKFGHPRPEVVNTAPPVAFATRPRYFDPAGSIQGARSNTVSIGNGTTTFGDFNGSDEVPFLAALNALASLGGGTVHIKPGTYVFANSVNVSIPVVFEGEGYAVTAVNNAVAAAAAFVVSSDVSFRDLTLAVSTGLAVAVDLTSNNTTDFRNCSITTGLRVNGTVAPTIVAHACNFAPSTAVPIVSSVGTAALNMSSFTACDLFASTSVFSCSLSSVLVDDCVVITGTNFVAPSSAIAYISNLLVQNCAIISTGSVLLTSGTQSLDYTSFTNNAIVATGTNVFELGSTITVNDFFAFDNQIYLSNTTSTSASPSYVLSTLAAGSLNNLRFEGNKINGPAGGYLICYASDAVGTLNSVRFCDNSVFRCAEMVRLGSSLNQMTSGDYLIKNNVHNNASNDAVVYGVRLFSTPNLKTVVITGNTFANYASASTGNRFGIDCTWNVLTGVDVVISENTFFNINAANAEGYGIYFGSISTASPTRGSVKILNNTISSIHADGGTLAAGIYLAPGILSSISSQFLVANNTIAQIGQSVTGVCTNAYGVRANVIGYLTIQNNQITGTIVTDPAGLAASIFLTSCGRVAMTSGSAVIVSGNVCSVSSGGSIYPASGYLIYLTGLCGNTIISQNVCSQYGSLSSTADGHIAVISDTTDRITITDNIINTSPVAGTTGILFKYAASSTTATHLNTLISGNTVSINNNVPSTAIYAEIGGNSASFVVEGNSIVETSLLGSHNGIHVQGSKDPAATYPSRSVVIRNNTLLGLKTGVLVTGRVGIAMYDCSRSTISNNHVDWLEVGIAEGSGILIGSVLLVNSWGFSCVGNFVNPDGNASTYEISFDSAWILAGIMDSNIVGYTVFSPGVINPVAAPGTWDYGTNKLS